MPCQDITDRIQLTFDADDCLVSYRLNKVTCGAPIGEESLLQALVTRRTMASLASLEATDVAAFYQSLGQPIAAAAEFLYHKHLLALQEAVRVLMGDASGGPDALCTTASAGVDGAGLHYEGLISVAGMTEKIKSCGHCGSCGSRRKSVAKTAPTL